MQIVSPNGQQGNGKKTGNSAPSPVPARPDSRPAPAEQPSRPAKNPPKIKLDKVAPPNGRAASREDRRARRAERLAASPASASMSTPATAPSFDSVFGDAPASSFQDSLDETFDFDDSLAGIDDFLDDDDDYDLDAIIDEFFPAAEEPHEFVLPDSLAGSASASIVQDLHFETEKLSRKELKKLSAEEQLAYKKTLKEEKKAAKKAKKRKKRSKRKTPIWQIIMLIIGLGLLAYPIIADRISAYQADQAITNYTQEVVQDPAVINQKLDEAQAYNEKLAGTYTGTDEVLPQEQLIVPGDTAFAWIEFPTLSEKLPIFHGTSEDSLQAGVGHLERTSMPIGGTSTHTVLTGHSGMPGSRMFDDIDRLEIGDIFMVHILNQDLAYKVISTEVVWPDEVESLAIQPGKDLCTLITCTPYGVNDHRLLVHAERTSYDEALALPSNNMMLFFNQRTIPFIIAIVLTVLFFAMLTIHRRRRHPLELGVDKAWNGLSDYTDDRRRFIGYSHTD